MDKLPGFLAAASGLLVALASMSAGIGVQTLLFRVALATVIAMAAGIGMRWFLMEHAGLPDEEPAGAGTGAGETGTNLDVTVSEGEFEDLKDLLTGESPEKAEGAATGVDAERMAQAVRLSMTQER
ncbi:MAG: hypothetical protein IT210_08020 [Armatimonadetes bacterium]|nr:hypothetical protein [Armatimonadota bacterium]